VTNDGRLFHARAAATGKARSPIVLQRVTGTTTAVDKLERRLRLVVTSVARLMLSARYTDAVPLRDRKTRYDGLKVIRSGIRNQWSSQSIVVSRALVPLQNNLTYPGGVTFGTSTYDHKVVVRLPVGSLSSGYYLDG